VVRTIEMGSGIPPTASEDQNPPTPSALKSRFHG